MVSPLRAQIGLANLSGAPPIVKSETPDPAATGSSAQIAYLAGVRETHNTVARPRIVGTLSLRRGGAA